MAFIDSLIAFEKGMRESAQMITSENPDILIAPMMGSVPFVDCMHITCEDFDPSIVHYLPASSGIEGINEIMRRWMNNFLIRNTGIDQPTKIYGIDEVVSGSSSVRVYRAITGAIARRKKNFTSEILGGFDLYDPDRFTKTARDLDAWTGYRNHDLLELLVHEETSGLSTDRTRVMELREQLLPIIEKYTAGLIQYKGIGIEDSKGTGKRSLQYREIVEKGGIVPVKVQAIVTMDHPELCPACYERIEEEDGSCSNVQFGPKVDRFVITPEYLGFLSNLARVAGKNPSNTAPVNMQRILEGNTYLSSK